MYLTKTDRMNAGHGSRTGRFAIVGIGCRLPGGVKDPESYWDLMSGKRSGICEIPEDRWAIEPFWDPNPNMVSTCVTKWGGFIDNVRDFDTTFFGLSPREAASMDPQQRVVLQTTYEAIEDSGIPLDVFEKERTGVFVGIQQSDYREVQTARRTNSSSYGGTTLALCIVANRVSHRLNLNGPSYAVDTACSSSLTALNQAMLNLRMGQCDYAAVTGVNLILSPNTYITFSQVGMLSPTGTLSTFDAAANGFVRGEGAGTVILKPLDRALADGNRIYAVIDESAANQDGYTSTITAPNQAAQIAMMSELMNRAGVTPDQIGYVEAHGTGTPIGDPIEAGAIGRVIGQAKTNGTIAVGSVKPNIGHLESGAGVSGLIKVALALHKGQIPPNVNFQTPNPRIPLDALNIRIPTETIEFPADDGVRRAIVNSFGFGGANASALLSSVEASPVEGVYRKPAVQGSQEAPRLFPISARSEKSLRETARRLCASLGGKGDLAKADLDELAAALGVQRAHHPHRAVVVARNRKELLRGLSFIGSDEADAEDPGNVFRGQAAPGRKIAFMFAGQGSQWWGMARGLLEHSTVFREAVEAYDAEFRKAAGWSIRDELLRDEADSRIDDTTVTQPALFAIQSGLCAVWKSWGVEPDMVVGHSIGEAAAAHAAGGISLAGAARFLSKRGAIRDQLGAKGAMAALGMNAEDVEALLPDHGLIGIAAVNGPASTTISGDYDKIHEFLAEFEAAHPNVLARALRVDTAWHSYQLEAGEDWFRREVAQIDWSVPALPFVSTVTGKVESRFDIDYGWLNLRKPVLFQQGIETTLRLGAKVFLEIGPHTTLSGPATSTASANNAHVEVINSLNRKQDDHLSMAQAAARLFVGGTDLNWKAINGEPSKPLPLPAYPWSNEPLWVDSEEWRSEMFAEFVHPLLGRPREGARPSWVSEINLKAYPYMADHRLRAECVFPGAGYMEIMFAAGRHLFGEGVIEIEHLTIHEALFIPQDTDVRFLTQFIAERNKIEIFTQSRGTGEGWVLRADGIVRINDVGLDESMPFDPEGRADAEVAVERLYVATSEHDVINYGPTFRTVRKLYALPKVTAARVGLDPELEGSFKKYYSHPTLLDACLQISDPRVALESLYKPVEETNETFMPIGAQRLRLFRPLPREFTVFASHTRPDRHTAVSTFTAYDLDGNPVFQAQGLMNRSLQSTGHREHPEGFAPHFALESYTEYKPPAQEEVQATEPGRWLVLAGDGPQAEALLSELEGRGAEVVQMPPEDMSATASMREDFADAIAQLMDEGPLRGILYAWSLAAPEIDEQTPASEVADAVIDHTKALVALGAALDEVRQRDDLPRLVVLTRNARPVPKDMAVDGLVQAPLASLSRTIANETPEFAIFQLDADAASLTACGKLVDALLMETDETEIAVRESGLYVPRVERVWSEEMPAQEVTIAQDNPSKNFVVTMENPGVIDSLKLVETPLAPLREGEVRVKIAAVGLNFRDVMAVTGLLPREAEVEPAWRNLGLEFGATVTEVGPGVTKFSPGDRVMGLGKRCLQRFMTVPEPAITPIPEHLGFEQAATIPSAFATAHYALNRVGRLSAGEKVLIHVATGGVGTAAVQMAQNVGAEIFATAGSPEKRQLLKDRGVDHVMNSRDLSFADEIMRITEGRGVDVVLNSLPGAYIEKGIEVLAPYGRFLEIGKRDVYDDSSIGMKALRRNVSVSVLDLAAMGAERPDLLGEMFHQLGEAFVRRELEPLPFDAFPVSQVADAVRFMSQARHIGKVVVTFDEPEFVVKADQSREVEMDPNAAYLVTGGNGGFGLTIADWFSRAGAGKLYLTSRSAKVADEDSPRLEAIRARGTEVELLPLDVTCQQDVERFVAQAVGDSRYPLRGVLHAAALIKDGFITQLTDEMIESVIRPKVAGAWALHHSFAKAGVQPDFIIGFSSIASFTGAAGQGNYVAANGFLDAFAAFRKRYGDGGGAIHWGAIAGKGVVARNENLQSYLESMGLSMLEEQDTPAGIKALLQTSESNIFYANADWQRMLRTNAALGKVPRFSAMLKKKSEKKSEIRERLLSLDGAELQAQLQEFVIGELGKVLKIETDGIDPTVPMNSLGLDSLSSFEFKMRIESALGLSLQVAKFLQVPTIEGLAEMLAQELEASAREAQEAVSSEGDDEGGTGSGTKAKALELKLTARGQGLLRDSVAFMTTRDTRSALEHRRMVEVDQRLDPKDVAKAARRLARRHKLLAMHFDPATANAFRFDGPGPRVVEADRIVPTDLAPLDLRAGEVVRITVAPGRTGSDLLLQLHHGVGDARSADTVMDELLHALAGQELGKPLSRKRLLKELSRRIYDPEVYETENDRAFWHYALGGHAPPVKFATRSRALVPSEMGRDHGTPARWSAVASQAALTEADVVLALADALTEATKHEGGVLLARHSCWAAAPAAAGYVAPFDGEHPVYVPPADAQVQRRDAVSRILRAAEGHDSIDLFTLRSELKDQLLALDAAPFQIGYSVRHAGQEKPPERDVGGFRVRRVTIPEAGIAYDLRLDVEIGRDGLARFTLSTDSDVVSATESRRILKALGKRLNWRDEQDAEQPHEAAD